MIVEEWNGRCAIYKVQGRPERSTRHPTYDCRHDRDGVVKREIAQLRRAFRSEDFAGCRSCGLPQALCERWTLGTRGFGQVRGAQCQAKWVLIDSVTALIIAGPGAVGTEAVLERIEREGFDVGQRERVHTWFGLRTKKGHTETNRLCVVFVELVQSFRERPMEFRRVSPDR